MGINWFLWIWLWIFICFCLIGVSKIRIGINWFIWTWIFIYFCLISISRIRIGINWLLWIWIWIFISFCLISISRIRIGINCGLVHWEGKSLWLDPLSCKESKSSDSGRAAGGSRGSPLVRWGTCVKWLSFSLLSEESKECIFLQPWVGILSVLVHDCFLSVGDMVYMFLWYIHKSHSFLSLKDRWRLTVYVF